MKTKDRWLGMIALVVGASILPGCYDAKEVTAFLQKPRSCVSGVEYRVYPPDVVEITSKNVPEIDGVKQQVRPDGKINLPLVGEISVAGRTPKEVEKAVIEAARDYYEQVDATLTVAAYLSQKYYVFGQVMRPGSMPWTGRDSVLDALARAQPTNLAWPERIVLVRGAEPMVGGAAPERESMSYAIRGVHPEKKENPRHRMTLNLMAMIRSGDLDNNVLLKPEDVIYVRANPLAAIGLAIQNLLLPIRPAAETVGMPAGAVRAVGGI